MSGMSRLAQIRAELARMQFDNDSVQNHVSEAITCLGHAMTSERIEQAKQASHETTEQYAARTGMRFWNGRLLPRSQ